MSREDMLSQSRALLDALKDQVNVKVYHYTSAEGFKGIITSGEIWLTNAAFVNDTTECRALWELDRKDVLGTEPFPNKHVESWWDQRAETRKEGKYNTYYIASFSKKENLLQQYRAYGTFCIGFEASGLMKRGFRLYDCVYNTREIREWIRRKSEAEQWGGECLNEEARRGAALNLMFAASIKYKSEHYAHEEEVRLFSESHHTWELHPKSPTLFAEDPPIHFRDHPVYKMPVPYVKFFIPPTDTKGPSDEEIREETSRQMKHRKRIEENAMCRELLPLKELWIGPTARQEEVRLGAEIMLGEKGYENVPVIASKIPYRGP